MSVSMTYDPVFARTKDVTRRKGWAWAKPGDQVTLVRKAMGRKPDEPIVRIAQVEFVAVRCERLDLMLLDPDYGRREVGREGFPDMSPEEFIWQFFVEAQSMKPSDEVTRVEWRYLNYAAPTPGRIWTDTVRLATSSRITLKRCCNGCGRELGDVHDTEMDAAIAGWSLPDVTRECGCAA